jgi:hypothetical protein
MAVYPCRCYVNTDKTGRELVSHGSADFPVACYHAIEDPDPVPPHWHNEFEIIAAKYLKSTDWPVSEIGRCCGFQEMGYFASQFRKLFGMTPTAYRKDGN